MKWVPYILMLNLHAVKLVIPEGANIIRRRPFIKTVEDVYEAMVNTVPGVQFGIAFNEASGDCLTRSDGTSEDMRAAAIGIATAVGAGRPLPCGRHARCFSDQRAADDPYGSGSLHDFLRDCESGRSHRRRIGTGTGVLGVIDGSSPKGVESEGHIAAPRVPAQNRLQTISRIAIESIELEARGDRK